MTFVSFTCFLRQEQIRKLNAEIVQVSEDLRNRQQDLKASRARIQTLEIQAKSYRSQIDLLESKFQEKELETKNIFDEMNHLKHDLLFAKDREKRSRDKDGLEIQEANRALTRVSECNYSAFLKNLVQNPVNNFLMSTYCCIGALNN